MATSHARLLVALLAVASAAVAADPPQVVVTNPKKTTAAVTREYPPPPGNAAPDLTVVTVVRLDKPKEKPLVLKGHKQAVTALDWSADGKRLVSGGLDGAVIVWDVAKGNAVATIDHGRAVGAVAFTKDGKTVVSAPFVPDPVAAANAKGEDDAKTPGGTLVVWDAATGKEVKKLDAEQGPLTAVARVPGTNHLATAGANKTLCLWAVSEGKVSHTFKLPAPLAVVVVAPNGRWVYGLATAAREVQVFDLDAKKALAPFKGLADDLIGVGVSPDGKLVAGVYATPVLDAKVPTSIGPGRALLAVFSFGLSEIIPLLDGLDTTTLNNHPVQLWRANGKAVGASRWKDLNLPGYGFRMEFLPGK